MENGELIELNSSLTKNMEAQNAIVAQQQDTITKQLEAFTKQQESMEKLLERIDQLSAGNHDNLALQQPAVVPPLHSEPGGGNNQVFQIVRIQSLS